jgi:hypothetical protein
MYIPIWLFVLTIVGLFLIYRKKNQKEEPETPQEIEKGLACKEENLLKELKNPALLKGRLQNETSLLECGKLNYIRLKERFKHDDIKRRQVNQDWFDYLEALNNLIYEREMLDVSTTEDEGNAHFDNIGEFHIKIQEIVKRFRDLLGNDYIEPESLKEYPYASYDGTQTNVIKPEYIQPNKQNQEK